MHSVDQVSFVVTAIGEHAHLFREAFARMDATYEEAILGESGEVVRFEVKCPRSKAHMLQTVVPIYAYAKVGIAGIPSA